MLDLFSRRVIGWAMDHCIDRHLVLSALDMALTGSATSAPSSSRRLPHRCRWHQGNPGQEED
ncbi:hypothetical protein D7V97_23685 [Corallococcus sp. CA053C]|nr:hypothetical protein D7V97_23685 [Corallococcus sp. CA053C]